MMTSQHFWEMRIQKLESAPVQISKSLRGLIMSGKIAPGERIPSTRELAALLGSHVAGVHAALTVLVKEGLLFRVPGLGTFVRQREEKLTRVGVFGNMAVNESLFVQALRKALKDELNQAGIEMDLRLDPRPEKEFTEPWLPFVQAAANREFQAVIVTEPNMMYLGWQSKLRVPTVFLGTENLPNQVNFDGKQFAELSLQALAGQGCRSVGIITPLSTQTNDGRPAGHFFEYFIDVSRDLGLTIKDEWMRVAAHEGAMRGRSYEGYGYEEFLKLWSLPERPEGLIVADDVAARGVILALQQQQVRVPEDLKLVLHKNESIDLLCPVPATFIVGSERELARALIDQVQKQFRGEPCQPILIPYRLTSHCGGVNLASKR